jgi:hypothetical protein
MTRTQSELTIITVCIPKYSDWNKSIQSQTYLGRLPGKRSKQRFLNMTVGFVFFMSSIYMSSHFQMRFVLSAEMSVYKRWLVRLYPLSLFLSLSLSLSLSLLFCKGFMFNSIICIYLLTLVSYIISISYDVSVVYQ